MKPVSAVTTAALAFALASILVTRILRAFDTADILSVIGFLLGLALLRLSVDGWRSLDAGHRAIVIGAAVGLTGVLIKLLFVALGIGVGADHTMHDAPLQERLLEHIHHLFFNVGFLFYLAGALVLGWGALRGKSKL